MPRLFDDGVSGDSPPMRGLLFFFEDGSTLSRPRLVQSLRQVLSSVGVDDTSYSGHSFRIGAATTAARMGVSDSLIKTLGKWKSSAFMLYIRTPWERLAEVSPTLARTPQLRHYPGYLAHQTDWADSNT